MYFYYNKTERKMSSMEVVENTMVMPEYEYKSNYITDEIWAEKEDRVWEDIRDNNFEEER